MLLKDNDPRFRGLSLKLAGFVIASLVSASAVVLWFAVRQGYFEAKTPIYFISDSGVDLKTGMAVKFSGFKIGEVKALTLDARGRVKVDVLIEDRHMRWVKADSIGRVGRDGPIGDSFIDMGLGSTELKPVARNTQLEFIPAKSFDDLVRQVQAKIVPVIDEAQALLLRINDPQGDFTQTLVNLHKVSVGLSDTRAKVDTALDNLNNLTAKEVPATLADTRNLLQNASTSLKEVETRLPGLLQTADRTLGNLESASGTTRKLIEQAGPDAISLLRDTRDLARKGNETVDAITESWPLNKLMTPPPGRPARGDSQE